MTKLNQIIAIEKGAKHKAGATLTGAHSVIQKAAVFNGLTRTYQPKDDEGEHLPSESTKVQVKVTDLIGSLIEDFVRMFDVVATKENANGSAAADVVVDGQTLLSQVPVTTLLFLEKQLVELRAFVGKLPTLDPADTWSLPDAADGAFQSQAVQTNRTKKVPQVLVKYAPTKEHPAQTEVFFEDQVVGTWTLTKFSGAVPASRVSELLDRIDTLAVAVKQAREEANSVEVTDVHIGKTVFDHLFA